MQGLISNIEGTFAPKKPSRSNLKAYDVSDLMYNRVTERPVFSSALKVVETIMVEYIMLDHTKVLNP